jgi:uncharacterized alpha/beta hydrolase family protein
MKKAIIIIVILAILATIIFFVVRKVKQNKEGDSSASNIRSDNFPLQKGSTGIRVKFLQKILNQLDPINNNLVEDGIFGTHTEATLYDTLGVRIVTKEFYYNSIDQQHTT